MKLVQHVGLIHAHESNFSITCGLSDCQSAFSKYESFRRHVYRKHSDSILPSVEEVPDVNDLSMDSENEETHAENDPSTNDYQMPLSINELLRSFRDNLVSFILKCREKNQLPISVQEEILDDVNFLFSFFKQNYDAFLSYHLSKSGFNIAENPVIQQVLQSNDFFEQASNVIRSEYKFKEHCKSKLDMTEPVEYTLRGSSGHKVGSYCYVPVSKVLKKYCAHEDVWEEIQSNNNRKKNYEVLSDYTDGVYFEEHTLFSSHPNALRLHFYEDEFEVVNPLGSKRNKHKLCAFYYTVGNMDGRYRSQLKHIHLALLVRYSYVKQCGWDVILKPMLDDLKELATNGFTVNVSGVEYQVNAAQRTGLF